MYRVAISQRFTKHILLSLLCFDIVFSATIKTVQRFEEDQEVLFDEDEVVYGEFEDILRNDFFHFTTRKRYIWEDYTVPTRDYTGYGGSSGNTDFLVYVFVPIIVIVLIVAAVYACLKNSMSENCCPFESESTSADRYTTLHRPPERLRDSTARVHRPPPGRNPGVNISFVDSSFASPPQSRADPSHAVGERPPDYSTVTLNDLINPTQPAFPVIRKGNETPPPEYGKDNPLFK